MQLAYTIAIDTPEAGGNRLMAMVLAMSLVRSELPVRDGLAGRAMAEAVMSAGLTERWSKSFAPDELLFGTQLCLMGCPLEGGCDNGCRVLLRSYQ